MDRALTFERRTPDMTASATAQGGVARLRAAGAGPIIAYLALCFIWGSTYLAIRFAVQSFPAHLMVGARSVLAGAVMVGVALASGGRLPNRAGWLGATASGLLLFTCGQSFLAFAETRVFSGPAAVIGATQALIMPLAAWAIGAAAAPGRATWFGLLTGFIGVAVLVNPGSHGLDPLGAAAVMGSVVTWSVGGAVAKRFPVDGVAMSAGLQMLIGGAACLAIAAVNGEIAHFNPAAVTRASWEGFFYLASFGSLGGFTAFAWLVQIWPPERLATYTYVNPIVALGLGALFAGEAIGVRDVFATLVILGAVAVVMFGGKRSDRREPN
jgi:drug/metabolite transporter (DMT)-like permease